MRGPGLRAGGEGAAEPWGCAVVNGQASQGRAQRASRTLSEGKWGLGHVRACGWSKEL